ncbi:MAG: multifunctional CCA tRNA nucleotidyl transferase/2'3'-cyclic phosphodiesterase/2'nucleotidase/phosphatase [Chromatiales bacterium]|jgi:tRNA nucleotidyltransferase (CCA-adding enzyme)
MEIYLVGGAVRDAQLDIPVRERDWVVVGSTEQQMLDLGYRLLDNAFPVFAHPDTGEEYALARTEIKNGTGYKGFDVYAGPDVTLEQDLKRRDLTINAMAQDKDGNIIDPFNGRQDLQDGKLRHVSEAFVEDPVRLLRMARFAAVLGQYGFHVSHPSFQLLKQMVASGELQHLHKERVWTEMRKALAAAQPWQFFKVLGKCGALDQLLPGVNRWINGEQMQHGEDAEPIQALQRVTSHSDDIAVRLATIMYAAVTYGKVRLHDMLPLEKELRRLLDWLAEFDAQLLSADNAEQLESLLRRLDVYRNRQLFDQVLQVLEAVYPDNADRCTWLNDLLDRALAVSAADLPPALSGKELGEALQNKRIRLIEAALQQRMDEEP